MLRDLVVLSSREIETDELPKILSPNVKKSTMSTTGIDVATVTTMEHMAIFITVCDLSCS